MKKELLYFNHFKIQSIFIEYSYIGFLNTYHKYDIECPSDMPRWFLDMLYELLFKNRTTIDYKKNYLARHSKFLELHDKIFYLN